MFLPVLLVRDYGMSGWVVFAVPNIIGAAAMGWVIRSSAASATMVEKHRVACISFSLVTIAFQVFFAGWMFTPIVAVMLVGAMAAVQLLLQMDRWVGILVWLLSTGAFGVFIASGGAFAESSLPMEFSRQPSIDLLWLSMACVFGFMLCPYLDLTFHRARGEALNARIAFTLGFGVFFLVMILFTLAYSGLLVGVAGDVPVNGPQLALQAVAAHMMLQLIFTVAVHAREISSSAKPMIAWPMVGSAGVIGAFLSMGRHVDFNIGTLLMPELIYRALMGFYGLVFPAYVWLCMIPSASQKRARIVFAIAVLLAMPMFWLGFIEQKMIWILTGIGLVLAARLLVGRPQRNIV